MRYADRVNRQARLLRVLGVRLRPLPARTVMDPAPGPRWLRRVCSRPAAVFLSAPPWELGHYCAHCVPTGPVRPPLDPFRTGPPTPPR